MTTATLTEFCYQEALRIRALNDPVFHELVEKDLRIRQKHEASVKEFFKKVFPEIEINVTIPLINNVYYVKRGGKEEGSGLYCVNGLVFTRNIAQVDGVSKKDAPESMSLLYFFPSGNGIFTKFGTFGPLSLDNPTASRAQVIHLVARRMAGTVFESSAILGELAKYDHVPPRLY